MWAWICCVSDCCVCVYVCVCLCPRAQIDCKDLADRQKRGESLDTANSLSRQLQTNAPGKSPEYLRGYADLRRGNIALNGIAYDKVRLLPRVLGLA